MGTAVCTIGLARTGPGEGYIPINFESAWFFGLAICASILLTNRQIRKAKNKEKREAAMLKAGMPVVDDGEEEEGE